MTANNTWVHVTDDHLMDAIKIHVTPHAMGYAISKHELESAYDTDHVIYKVAKEMGHLLAKEIEKKLHEILLPATPTPKQIKVHKEFEKAFEENMESWYSKGWSLGKGVTPVGSIWNDIDTQADLGTAVTEMLYAAIPGFEEMRQPCPYEDCKSKTHRHDWNPLRNTIIHLNDWHKWPRERIADWLETLDHDLTFKTPEEVNADAGHADT